MKLFLAYFAPVFLISLSTFAQVGVGTTVVDDSAILEIESNNTGVLLPRLDTSDRASLLTPANALIIFNSDSQTLEYNRGTTIMPAWVAIQTGATVTSNTLQSAKYTYDALAIANLNTTGGVNAPLFTTELWNDNTSLYVANTDEITITETGRYKLISNISIQSSSSGSRKAPEAYFTVNTLQVGTFASTGYMRETNNHDTSSLHLNEILELSGGDVVSVRVRQAANGNLVTFRGAEASNFYIEKID